MIQLRLPSTLTLKIYTFSLFLFFIGSLLNAQSPKASIQLSPALAKDGSYSLNDTPLLTIEFSNYPRNTPYYWQLINSDGAIIVRNELMRPDDRKLFLQIRSVALGKLVGLGNGTYLIQLEHDQKILAELAFNFIDPGLDFDTLWYIPNTFKPGNGFLIAVHGAGRDPTSIEGHLRFFKPLAEKLGRLLITPNFSAKHFPSYQTLFDNDADLHFRELLRAFSTEYSANAENLYLWGHSGGGQFVHRYCMMYPNGIQKAIISGAGWFTFPNTDIPYPTGIQEGSISRNILVDPQAMSALAMLVIVGDSDVEKEGFVTGAWVDWQGSTRVERAENWFDAMKKWLNYDGNNKGGSIDFKIVKAGHGDTRNKSLAEIESFFTQ